MKKSKKIIGIILCIILIASVTTAIFVATATAKKVEISITADKTELSAGETATVSVTVNANFPVATMSIPVFYDNTLVDVSDATATLTDYAVKSAVTDTQSADTSKVFANTGLNSDKYGFVLVNYIGGAGAEVPETTDSVVLTFKITAKAGVSGTEVVKCVSQSAKTDDNIAGMLYFGATINENTIDAIPENIENIDLTNAQARVNIVSGANMLMVEEDFEYADYVVIDTNNTNNGEYTGIIYGIDTLDQNEMMEILATLDDALTTSQGDEYLVIEANENGVESTGATITVVDADGNAVETYVFVYFGDVDGDGYISSQDGFLVETYELEYVGIESYASFVAADVDGDGMASGQDAFLMETYELEYVGIDYQYNLGQNAMSNTYEWIN